MNYADLVRQHGEDLYEEYLGAVKERDNPEDTEPEEAEETRRFFAVKVKMYDMVYEHFGLQPTPETLTVFSIEGGYDKSPELAAYIFGLDETLRLKPLARVFDERLIDKRLYAVTQEMVMLNHYDESSSQLFQDTMLIVKK